MPHRLDGAIAIISGAARGIGAAQARTFVSEGAAVVIGDLRDELGEALAAELGSRATYVHLDVTQAADWDVAVERCHHHFGAPTVLVNNAGILGTNTPIVDLSEAGFRSVLDVNLVGTFLGIKAVSPSMINAGRGSIINVSSNAAFIGAAGLAGYTASKFAVRGLTKTAALELGRYNIRVNSMHPGSIETDLVQRPPGNAMFARQAIARVGQADEIAQLALFLASNESSFSTGAEFVADGGYLAGTVHP